MKVILLTDVPKIGRKGELKEVSDGFAKNMLIRKGLAMMATPEAQSKLAKESKEKKEAAKRALTKTETDKKELERRVFSVKTKVGDQGQVFGGAQEKDIIEAIYKKTKIRVEKSKIEGHKGIKQIGEHAISVKLGHGVTAKTKINLEAL